MKGYDLLDEEVKKSIIDYATKTVKEQLDKKLSKREIYEGCVLFAAQKVVDHDLTKGCNDCAYLQSTSFLLECVVSLCGIEVKNLIEIEDRPHPPEIIEEGQLTEDLINQLAKEKLGE